MDSIVVGREHVFALSDACCVVSAVAVCSVLRLPHFILICRSAGHIVQLKQSKRRTERRIRPQRAKVSVLSNTGSKCPRIGRTSYALTQPLVTGNGKMPLRKR